MFQTGENNLRLPLLCPSTNPKPLTVLVLESFSPAQSIEYSSNLPDVGLSQEFNSRVVRLSGTGHSGKESSTPPGSQIIKPEGLLSLANFRRAQLPGIKGPPHNPKPGQQYRNSPSGGTSVNNLVFILSHSSLIIP